MAEFLDNNEDRVREEILAHYRFKTNLLIYIGERIDKIKKDVKASEYDYCTTSGQLMELESLNAFLRDQSTQTEPTNQNTKTD
jgi:hypothetical protein